MEKHYYIECEAIDCLHNIPREKRCCVENASFPSFINISKDGSCVDYTPLTEEELQQIIGISK